MSNGDGDTRPAIEAYPSVAREGARPQELAAVAADLHKLRRRSTPLGVLAVSVMVATT